MLPAWPGAGKVSGIWQVASLILWLAVAAEGQVMSGPNGSGGGEREASMARPIAFEPLPASVLLNEFALLKRFAMPLNGV